MKLQLGGDRAGVSTRAGWRFPIAATPPTSEKNTSPNAFRSGRHAFHPRTVFWQEICSCSPGQAADKGRNLIGRLNATGQTRPMSFRGLARLSKHPFFFSFPFSFFPTRWMCKIHPTGFYKPSSIWGVTLKDCGGLRGRDRAPVVSPARWLNVQCVVIHFETRRV